MRSFVSPTSKTAMPFCPRRYIPATSKTVTLVFGRPWASSPTVTQGSLSKFVSYFHAMRWVQNGLLPSSMRERWSGFNPNSVRDCRGWRLDIPLALKDKTTLRCATCVRTGAIYCPPHKKQHPQKVSAEFFEKTNYLLEF